MYYFRFSKTFSIFFKNIADFPKYPPDIQTAFRQLRKFDR